MTKNPLWPLRTGGTVFSLALLVRIAVCLWAWNRVPPTADGRFYHVVAERIAHGLGYTWLWPDGAVTYAAHYPVGYPAMMGPIYWAIGPVPGAVMVINAIWGALGVWAGYRLSLEMLGSCLKESPARRAAFLAGVVFALSPTLVLYTPALMTEGVVGSMLLLCTLGVAHLRGSTGNRWLFATIGLVLGATVLLRPQALLLVPALGALSVSGQGLLVKRRVLAALLLTGCSLVVVLPWTLRNCDKMERCMLVSANGGWNLLIGTFQEGRGAWISLDGERVPSVCRQVYQEADKDACFATAGRKRILSHPLDWVKLVPAKWQNTFDYSAAAAAHLQEAGALGKAQLQVLRVCETAWQRLLAALVLLGVLSPWFSVPTTAYRRWAVLGLCLGVFLLMSSFSWLVWILILILTLLSFKRLTQPAWGYASLSLGSTLAVHAVFFGAARYAIPTTMAVSPLCALGLAEVLRQLDGWSRSRGGAVSV